MTAPSNNSPRRKCACTCPPECECACSTCHCSCSKTCEGNCYEGQGRNLVVSIDGTSNQFGSNNTNVVELHSRILKDNPAAQQLTFYVSGIGTYAPPTFRSFAYWKQLIANKLDLAIAWNFERHVKDAYRWLADNYRRGDKIFLFGFSRGAYQVRALAGIITTMGLMYPGNDRLIPFAYELYAKRHKGKATKDAVELCKHFKQTFSREDHDVRVHFVGVWDTVSSVGIFRGPPLPLTSSADHICYFRHALAIDERRVKFLPEYIDISSLQVDGNCYETPSRNLVVSIDGSSNQFGPNVCLETSLLRYLILSQNTDLLELHNRILKVNPAAQQLTFYVSGIGTYAPPTFRSFAYWKQLIANKLDLAIAWWGQSDP
ncbi:hypothetical protein K438DRAFT_1631522 [Mycena galopus ATCC 62051]|nr:hypothetical protein K438DRAFT_1631525 [Mycena galopus ATCC 62051]KAF8144606.1 hypothetical protein K438DRAFT_1631522 [Mycena galopus ATCC 62051]